MSHRQAHLVFAATTENDGIRKLSGQRRDCGPVAQDQGIRTQRREQGARLQPFQTTWCLPTPNKPPPVLESKLLWGGREGVDKAPWPREQASLHP